jgi:hypothetical protein
MIELLNAAFAGDSLFRKLYPYQNECPKAYRQDLKQTLAVVVRFQRDVDRCI